MKEYWCLQDVVEDQDIALRVCGKPAVEFLNTRLAAIFNVEAGLTDDQAMVEGTVCRLFPGVHFEPDRPQLHLDDRVMAVTAMWCGGQAGDKTCPDRSQDALERYRRQVMAFVHDYMAIVGHQIIHAVFAHQALDHGNIESASGLASAATDSPDLFGIQPEEQRELSGPLIE